MNHSNQPVKEISIGSAKAVRIQVEKTLAQVVSETEEMSYLIDKIDTNVSFIASEAQDVFNKWKQGLVYQRLSLRDLCYQFRLKTYAVDSGWDTWHVIPEWLKKTRKKIRVLLGFLGADPFYTGDIRELLQHMEEATYNQGLGMNVDLVESLTMIKDVLRMTDEMEQRLEDLKRACERRSQQIIAPDWEPRGLI